MGLRDFRVAQMAVIDFVATFLVVFYIHNFMWVYPLGNYEDIMTYTKSRSGFQYTFSLVLLFITFVGIGTMAHYMFRINSKLCAYLGFNALPRHL